MCRLASDPSTRDAGKLVAVILRRSGEGLGLKSSTAKLVESLIWPFVARRSLREEWFSDRELDRFVNSMRKTAQRIAKHDAAEDNRDQSFLKFWLDCYLCRAADDPNLPTREEWITETLFCGWCKNFVNRRILAGDLSFIYSLQKGSKRLWPSLGEKKKVAALEKHHERLSGEYYFQVPSDLAQWIEEISQRVFPKQLRKPMTKFLPSGSACLQNPRSKGGSLSLFDNFHFPFSGNPDDKTAAERVGLLPTLIANLDRWRNRTFQEALRKSYENLNRPDPKGTAYGLRVAVQAIPEPGKFRIITKGDGFLYSALQPMQGAMLAAWKKHPASTMRYDDLSPRVQKIQDELYDVPNLYWCSVDYEAATDLMKRDCSFIALTGCIENALFPLAVRSLLPGLCLYPKGLERFDCVAREGQLMGHPLSFPLLCVINLAVYHCALDRWVNEAEYSRGEFRRRMDLVKRLRHNVIVNGDDMLFKCEFSFYSVFMATAAGAGLKVSQGKNYLSTKFCMINSQIFVSKGPGGVRMERQGYLNLKFLSGTSLKTGDSSATPTEIGTSLNKMISLCPWAKSIIPTVMNRWKADFVKSSIQPNWYVPVHLGGFGLDRIYGPKSMRITRRQRKLAAIFVMNPQIALYRSQQTGPNAHLLSPIPLKFFQGALARWRMVPGEYVQNSFESFEVEDWLEKVAYAYRASRLGMDTELVSPPEKVIRKLKIPSNQRSLSLETMESYWKVRFVATFTVPSPPMLPIRGLKPTPVFVKNSEVVVPPDAGQFQLLPDESLTPEQMVQFSEAQEHNLRILFGSS